MEYYVTIKKNKFVPFVTAWMNLENIMLNKLSQSKKDKYHMISLIRGIYEHTKLTSETETHS